MQFTKTNPHSKEEIQDLFFLSEVQESIPSVPTLYQTLCCYP